MPTVRRTRTTLILFVAAAVSLTAPASGQALRTPSRSMTPAASTAQTTQSTAAAPTCGGEIPAAKPGGGAWKCTLDDEFDAATGDANSLNTKLWVPQVTSTSGYTTGSSTGGEACYENNPANVSVSGGYLHLTATRVSAQFQCGLLQTQYTSGMVSTAGTFSQTYGRFEIRAELPQSAAQGLQETLWLWPVNSDKFGAWPASGEVDLAEFYSDYESDDIPVIHYDYAASTTNAATGTNVVTKVCPIDPTQFNDYAVVWEPGIFTISVNGTTCMTDDYVPDNGLSSPEPFNQPFFLALTQALGSGPNAFEPGVTQLPATTLIKYVRVWE